MHTNTKKKRLNFRKRRPDWCVRLRWQFEEMPGRGDGGRRIILMIVVFFNCLKKINFDAAVQPECRHQLLVATALPD